MSTGTATPSAAKHGPASPSSAATAAAAQTPAGGVPPVHVGARALLAVTAALLVAAVVGQLSGAAAAPLDIYRFESVYVLSALTAPVLGVLLVRRVPHNPIGWLLLATGAAGALAAAAMSFADVLVGAWFNQWSPWLTIALLPVPLLVFPDGQLPSPRWRLLWRAALAGVVLPALLLAAAAVFEPWRLTDVDAVVPPAAELLRRLAITTGFLLLAITSLSGLLAIALRWRRAHDRTRAQLRVLGAGTVVIVALLAVEVVTGQGVLGLAAMALPVSMTIAILRHRLLDLDTLINRSLVYAVLTAAVVGTYAAVVTGLGALLGDSWSWGPSVIATGLIAVAFQPLRERVQRAANRLLYGDRDDPYAVVSRLGERLERAVDPDAVLPGIVATVESSLQVPYVAVQLRVGDGYQTAADNGRTAVDVAPVAYPMTYLDEEVGRLLVSPRSPSHPFTAAEDALLRSLARQAGVAARSVRLLADLRHSRERIVRGREEERRRLRRDLHDGLGPRLSGLLMQIGAGQVALRRGSLPPDLLATVEAELRTCVAEVRRVIDDLRPPALDELGLVGAVRRQVEATAGAALEVTVSADEPLGALPAAVEVAAYRIVAEAVTNVVKHAEAQHCTVAIASDGATLRLEVADDGVGFRGPRPDGVGLGSMRERAEELGGTLTLDARPGGGTRVRATLPLRAAGVTRSIDLTDDEAADATGDPASV